MKSTSIPLLSIISLFLFNFLSFPSPSLSELCHPNDKKVLLQIKKVMKNPYHFTSWHVNEDCCTYWNSVECDEKTHRVTSLEVSLDPVSGPIPAEVGDLPYLDTLIFRKLPNLSGHIPSAISKLSHLRYLDFSWTKLTGPVPSFLSQLKKLELVFLNFNQLTGSIPPSLSLLPNLQALHLDRNNLTGTIPDSFGNFVRKEIYGLYLSHNQLTGTVPKSFGSMNFNVLELQRNKLEGDISFLFGANKTLQTADFSRNLFKFDFSKVKFPKDMIYLDLNHNQIYGSLPGGLSALGLQTFNVSYNRLCGKIPTGENLKRFDYSVYFHNKCLCGAPLPKC